MFNVTSDRTGASSRAKINWAVSSNMEVTAEMAIKLQGEKGKPYEGYGFYNFKCEQIREDFWQASWQCAASTGD